MPGRKMRGHRLLPFIIAFAAACTSVDPDVDSTGISIITSIEARIASPETRTTIEADGHGLQTLWSYADCIAVTDGTVSSTFRLREGEGTTRGVFGGSIATLSKTLYGIYPAGSATVSNDGIQIRIPTVQSYTSDTDPSIGGKNLMAGVSHDGKEFRFSPLASIARFSIDLDTSETISSLTVRCEDEAIAGDGDLDPANATIGSLSSKWATLSYSDPVSSANSDGWMLIAPVDFTVGKGKVFYDIVTDRGTYTFCRRPGKRFLGGYAYTFPIHVSDFTKVSSESDLADGKYMFLSNSSTLTVRQVRATDSTITVAWSKSGFPANYSSDIADKYTIHLYGADGEEIVAWSPNQNTAQCAGSSPIYKYSSSDPSYPTRWCFSGLEPDTEYSVLVRDRTTGTDSNVLHTSTSPVDCGRIVTTAIDSGDVFLFQNFSRHVWFGDPIGMAAGYAHVENGTIRDITDGTAHGDITSTSQTEYQYYLSTKEQCLFSTCAKTLECAGMEEWGYWRNPSDDATSPGSKGVYIHPGYMKMGVKSVRAGIVTPEMKPLLAKATIRVSFKASVFGTKAQVDDPKIGIKVLDSCSVTEYRVTGNEISSTPVTLPKAVEWHTYTVEIGNVTPTSRLVFFGNASSVTSTSNRFCIDDIKAELVRYEEEVDTTSPVITVTETDSTSATIEWKSSESGEFNVMLYTDPECTILHQSYPTTISDDARYIVYPQRFTFTYLSEGKAYYAMVRSGSGKTSKPARVETNDRSSIKSDIIVSNSFDKFVWGGDYMRRSNSVCLDGVAIESYEPSTLEETMEQCVSTKSPTADGPRIESLTAGLSELCGIKGWSALNACIRPGYCLIGMPEEGGWIETPAIECLDRNDAEIEVSCKVCPYVTDINVRQCDHMLISVIDRDGKTIAQNDIPMDTFRSEPGWSTIRTSFSGVGNGCRVRFSSGDASQASFCIDDIAVTSDSGIAENTVYGHVAYSDGTPAEGIVMSDGFHCTTTDSNGDYRMECTKDVWYIYYSIPSDCKVDLDSNGQPCFFRRYTYGEHRFDFTLTRMAEGKESVFRLFCLADPQCKSTANVSRFSSETVPALNSDYESSTVNCYGVTLGDLVFSIRERDTNNLMPSMRTACTQASFPIFQTMGNHDYTFFNGTENPNYSDETSSTPNLRAQRAFETCYGPVNYSWNRSDTHIVCMRNIVFTSLTNASSYEGAFTDEQYRWLEEDLSHVDKSKMVILCVHIPLLGVTSKSNVSKVLSLIGNYRNAQVMSGHTHYMRNNPNVAGSGVREHVHAAVCGAWWASNLNGDGCPNGYGVFDIAGNSITDYFYKGTNTGMNDRGYQLRLYRGNQTCGGSYEYFRTQYGSDVLLANVFNADSGWKIEVYEDDVLSGTMALIPGKKYTDDTLPYVETVSPTMVPSDSSQDWWTIGYHVGVRGIGHTSGERGNYMTACYHMYTYTLKNPEARIKVVATDFMGNTYTQEEVMPETTTGSSYPKYIPAGNH